MKRGILVRLLGIVAMFGLLVAALPLSAVLAVDEVAVDPEEAEVWDTVEVEGDDFTPDAFLYIILSSQDAELNDDINDEVTSWELLAEIKTNGVNGDFNVDVVIPDELTDGVDDEDLHGGTYFIYITRQGDTNIEAKAELLIIGFASLTIDEDEGFVGDIVEVSGEGFIADEVLTVEWDSDDVTSDIDGDDETDGSGEFTFELEIPEGIIGDHEITVSDETGNIATVIFTIEPQIILNPTFGPPGTTVVVTGMGFDKSEDFDSIQFNNVEILNSITGDNDADNDGSFEFSFTVPATLGSGIYTLEVEGEDGSNVEATFEVEYSVEITPQTSGQSPGYVGMEITITGTGFSPSATATVTFVSETTALTTAPTDTNGTFSATFNMPEKEAGVYQFVVTDGIRTSDPLTFVMEGDAPDAPQLVAPPATEKAEQPVVFDWTDVTDDSGVSYTLQISGDANFTTQTLERTDIGASGYTMTEAQELDSVGSDEPYYWRVKTIDGASNESAWSVAATFTVGSTFNWPTWAWWVVGGIVVLFVALFVFYMGRRSITY